MFYRIAQQKYKKAVRVSKLLHYVPGIKMIAVCNSLSYNRAFPESDIDLFIIAAKARIWTVRFFSLLILTLLGLRPPGENKICLSFFIAENNLNLEPYKICVQDRYLAFWIKQLKPLYIEDDLYKKFVQANQWVKKFGRNSISQSFKGCSHECRTQQCFYIPNYKRRVKKSVIKHLINALVTSLDEKMYKYIQLKIMPLQIKKMACAWDSSVVISDQMLKFHLNDRRLCLRGAISNCSNF